MKSKTTLLAATLFAAAAFAVPAEAYTPEAEMQIVLSPVSLSETLTINGETYEISKHCSYSGNDGVDVDIAITNGGVLSLGSYQVTLADDMTVTISNSSYLVSTSSASSVSVVSISDDSTAAVTGDGSYTFTVEGTVTIDFDSTYLAELVAGTATEYTYQIFDSAVLSNSSIGAVTIDDSWQDTDGIASVTYDESTGTVTVTIAVPEPSAFGVIAGISALALVAARRRRSRKIA